MADWIIGAIVIGAMALAARYTWRKHKSGGCPGCAGGCGSGACPAKKDARDES